MDQQKRFVLAMVISGAILLIWQYFFAPQPPPPGTDAEAAVTEQKSAPKEKGKGEVETSGAPQQRDANAEEGAAPVEPVNLQKDIPVRRNLLLGEYIALTLTNQGGRVVAAHLRKPEQYQARGDLLGAFPEDAQHFPFGVDFVEENLALPDDVVYQWIEEESVVASKSSSAQKLTSSERKRFGQNAESQAYQTLVYRYTDPQRRFSLTKRFTVDPKVAYGVMLDIEVTNLQDEGTLKDKLAIDIWGYQDPDAETSFFMPQTNALEGLCYIKDDVERETFSSIDSPMRFDEGTVNWAGIDTRYFLWAAIPKDGAQRCSFEVFDKQYLRARLTFDAFDLAPGESFQLEQELFVGPKDIEALDAVGHNLKTSVDYGILAFLAYPLRWLLQTFYNGVGNWGLAIILLTLLIKIATWPLTQKSYESSERMKKIQPQLSEIKKKYENDQARQMEETMKLFREAKASPASGCLPMLLQMPILYALYVMIYNSVELYQADFILWYTDLSSPDPYYVLPILMGIVSLIQQSFMTMETPNPQTKIMMKVMPIMFTVFMLFLPSGLVLYYCVNLILGLGQQLWIRRRFARKAEAATASGAKSRS